MCMRIDFFIENKKTFSENVSYDQKIDQCLYAV